MSCPCQKNNTITVKLHYHRPDRNYTGWNFWVWGLGMTSCQYELAWEGDHKCATVTVPGRATGYISFIPRYSTVSNNWAAQEYGERRVDLSDVVCGTVHCHIYAGQFQTQRSFGEDAVCANKLSSVKLDYDTNRVHITAVSPLTDPTRQLQLLCDGIPVGIHSLVYLDGVYVLEPAVDLTLPKLYRYQVYFEDFAYGICYTCAYDSQHFQQEYVYHGDDFGAIYRPDSTDFNLWSPVAEGVKVCLYATGNDRQPGATMLGTYKMVLTKKGVWRTTVPGDLHGIYYTYLVKIDGKIVEVCDPYARTTGVNGQRAMVMDMQTADPEGWAQDTNPNPLQSYTDAVIYEAHVRDFSIHASSGVEPKYRGKYLGMVQTGTTSDGKTHTTLDHMKKLGVTHLHLLPVYDFGSVDETSGDGFNWGYDPVNYNVPEGSYATDPYDGAVRVREFKQMVKTLHDHGISVIMDVVYNHVYEVEGFCCNRIVPGYFSRRNPDGSYSDGSGCGNDTASERAMVRKYIVDSVVYWASQYHINGFRFDLVGLLDADTINAIVEAVHTKYPDVIFYGEGWTMQTAVPAGTAMATQANASGTPAFAYFSDTIRNLLTGHNGENVGYVSGRFGVEGEIVRNFMANPWFTDHPQQVIQYASCHDNHTLAAKLLLSTGKNRIDWDVVRMNKLTAAIYLTAQGIPFVHAGEEMLRLKIKDDGSFSENSYNAGDSVNAIRWEQLENGAHADLTAYYKGLIAFRKAHGLLRLSDADSIRRHVRCVGHDNNVVKFVLEDEKETIIVVFNPNHPGVNIHLPAGSWNVCVDGEKAGNRTLYTALDTVCVPGISAMVLVRSK